MKTLDIPHKPKRDHRTVKRFVADSEHTRVCADKGTIWKVSARQIDVRCLCFYPKRLTLVSM